MLNLDPTVSNLVSQILCFLFGFPRFLALQLLRTCATLMLMESVITHLDKALDLRQVNDTLVN